MKITIDVDTGNNEGTDSPYWLILDPHQNMSCDIYLLAGMITGPFFSRAEAESFLKATRYNFSERARVFCNSGYYARQYKDAIRHAERRGTV